ncbi:MAG: hypothetical protein ABI045_04880 [Flavobacteriales bacterium]
MKIELNNELPLQVVIDLSEEAAWDNLNFVVSNDSNTIQQIGYDLIINKYTWISTYTMTLRSAFKSDENISIKYSLKEVSESL